MNNILLSPPIAFLIVLFVIFASGQFLGRLSFRRKAGSENDREKAYACGEEMQTNLMQPDYSQFFPFAFFFTILHVITLMVTTVPAAALGSLAMAVTYIIGAIVALIILFRG